MNTTLMGQTQMAQKMGPVLPGQNLPAGARMHELDFSSVPSVNGSNMAPYFPPSMGMNGMAPSLSTSQHPTPTQPQTQAMMNGFMSPGMTNANGAAPSTPLTSHATPQPAASNTKGRMNTARASVGPSQGRAVTDMPMSPWQAHPPTPHAHESPSAPMPKKERPRKHTRSSSTKTPSANHAATHGAGAAADRSEDVAPKDEPQDWDSSTKSDSALAPAPPSKSLVPESTPSTSGAQPMLSMPSMMDDMVTGSLSSASGTGNNADDFSVMFGVSDIFDFDGGDTTSNSGGGFLGNSTFSGEGDGGDKTETKTSESNSHRA